MQKIQKVLVVIIKKFQPEISTESIELTNSLSEVASLNNTDADLSGTMITNGTELIGNARAATQSWTGTLANEGDMSYVFATLEPNQIVNATLECPINADLNYDLFIYNVDDTGTLGQLCAASTTSTYINGRVGKTVDEGAAYVNRTTQTNDYAVIVFATKGGSATETFKLTVSASAAGTFDAAEPNDSPFTAYSVALGNSISGPNLHAPNDQDWYVMSVDSTYSAARITAVTSVGGYNVELYRAEDSKMIRENGRSNSEYSLSSGVYFIRVYGNVSGFTSQTYTLNIVALSYASESSIDFSDYISGHSASKFMYIKCPTAYELEVELTSVPNNIVFCVSEANTDDPSRSIYQKILTNTGGNVTFSTNQLLLKPGQSGVYIWFYNEYYSSTVQVEATIRSKNFPFS